MQTKIYRVKGQFVLGSQTQKFTKEPKSFNEENIYEKIYSLFGSQHGINRNKIDIQEIEEITPDEVEDLVLKGIL